MATNIGYSLWLDIVKRIPFWERSIGVFTLACAFFVLLLYKVLTKNEYIFHAFEKIKLKRRDLDKALLHTLYFEITIPKDSQATAFQIQQKILKSFHSVYSDPIAGPHNFSRRIYFFQKLYRIWKVYRAKQVFFTMQIWAQYPYTSFRLSVPHGSFNRIKKAIFNAYPNAEISMLKQLDMIAEVSKFQKSYLSYGETTIEGKFYHRVKTFRDVSSDPVDSVVATMEGLEKGSFMVYNITVSPASHYFNQVIYYLLEQQEQQPIITPREYPNGSGASVPQKETTTSLSAALSTAMLEKMKAPLFQTIVSYWAVASTKEEAESKVSNIQAVLTEINQKNMNMLRHDTLFTKSVESLEANGKLEGIIAARPVLRMRPSRYWPFSMYKNYGQIIGDSELYSFWHLPNTTIYTVSSIKMTKFKKRPASQQMREYPEGFFISLGKSNFRMQEDTTIGIPTWDDMKKHIYILGGTGSGKSETLKTILSNLLQKEGKEQTACLIIDPKNDFATDLLTMIPEHRKQDVVYFNPQRQKERPLSFPFFSQNSHGTNNDERIEFLISIMKRFVQIDSPQSWGPELENVLRQLFATAYVLPEQSLSGLDMLLHEPQHIKNILKYLPSRLQKFWTGSILKRSDNDLAKYLATTNNKLGKFLDYPEFLNIADQLDSKITFEEMIQTGKIFIANLGSSSEQMKKYYSVYLTAHIAEAIFGQAKLNAEDRKPALFVVDEFQRVASDIFETLFSEVRAFNTALVISNQFMGQLDERIQKSIESNIATKIFMRTQSVDDAAIAEKILGATVVAEDIINLPTGSGYIKTLVRGTPQEAMSINIQKTVHPTDITKDTETYYIEQTQSRYGTPLDVIKQKRDTVNSIYYSAEREQVFFEHMDRQGKLLEAVSVPVASVHPGTNIVPKDYILKAKEVKTIFDF